MVKLHKMSKVKISHKILPLALMHYSCTARGVIERGRQFKSQNFLKYFVLIFGFTLLVFPKILNFKFSVFAQGCPATDYDCQIVSSPKGD